MKSIARKLDLLEEKVGLGETPRYFEQFVRDSTAGFHRLVRCGHIQNWPPEKQPNETDALVFTKGIVSNMACLKASPDQKRLLRYIDSLIAEAERVKIFPDSLK